MNLNGFKNGSYSVFADVTFPIVRASAASGGQPTWQGGLDGSELMIREQLREPDRCGSSYLVNSLDGGTASLT